jgi:hypothetical protein
VEVLVLGDSLTSLWPASFGLFACLDVGSCPLFLFLLLSWVLSFYTVLAGFHHIIASIDFFLKADK